MAYKATRLDGQIMISAEVQTTYSSSLLMFNMHWMDADDLLHDLEREVREAKDWQREQDEQRRQNEAA